LAAWNDQIQDNKTYQKSFNLYTYNAATALYGDVERLAFYVQRQYYNYPQNTDQLSINYAHSFGGIHNVSALVLMEGNEQSGDNFAAYRQLSIPVDQLIAGNAVEPERDAGCGEYCLFQYATNSFVGRATYDYSGKYLAEFSFRADKSSKFAPGQGYGFFPSGSVGWRISEEKFWKKNNALDFIDNLKVRASYGVLGDDGQLYYQFLSGYNYPASGNYNQLPSGAVFGSNFRQCGAEYGYSESFCHLGHLAYFRCGDRFRCVERPAGFYCRLFPPQPNGAAGDLGAGSAWRYWVPRCRRKISMATGRRVSISRSRTITIREVQLLGEGHLLVYQYHQYEICRVAAG
jgi:hypothetical protein